ncbi:MAG TPA: GNAT family N-acetyltransferase [Dehalococcoidia bacterium]|nr:GNAT family N-acetyltransferase [Dehalococcoidia bacterium]
MSATPIRLEGQLVRLREKRLEDASRDYAWRKDPELCSYDAVAPIRTSYAEYLADYRYDVLRESRLRMRFAVETLDGLHIGNCSCYDIDEARRQAELGIMIGDKRFWSQGYGTDIIQTLLDHVFASTRLERVYLYTLEWNTRAQACFRKVGFREYSRVTEGGHRFVVMDVRRQDWAARRSQEIERTKIVNGS